MSIYKAEREKMNEIFKRSSLIANTKPKTLKKSKPSNKITTTSNKSTSAKKKKTKKQSSVMVCKSKKSFPIFWTLVGITFIISFLIVLVLFVSIH